PMVALGVRGTRLAHGPRAQEDTPRRPALSVHVGRGSGQPARGPRGCAVRVAAAVVDAIALAAARTHAEPVTVVGAAVGVITAGLAALQRAQGGAHDHAAAMHVGGAQDVVEAGLVGGTPVAQRAGLAGVAERGAGVVARARTGV